MDTLRILERFLSATNYEELSIKELGVLCDYLIDKIQEHQKIEVEMINTLSSAETEVRRLTDVLSINFGIHQ